MKQNTIFVEVKSQLLSHVTGFYEELKQVFSQLAVLVPRLSDSLEKYAPVGARASVDQALHVAHGFLSWIQGLSTDIFYREEKTLSPMVFFTTWLCWSSDARSTRRKTAALSRS